MCSSMVRLDLDSSESEVLRRARNTRKITEADGRRWVVKSLSATTVKPWDLFSEYVIGALAAQFGLRWPKVRIAKLLQTESDIEPLHAVAIEWIDGLTCLFPEQKPFVQELSEDESLEELQKERQDARKTVKAKVKRYLDADSSNLDQVCAFEIFSRWAYPSDTKNDILHVDPTEKLWFLDGEHYMGNNVYWPPQGIPAVEVRVNRAYFFEFISGLRGRLEACHFTPWLEKLTDENLRCSFEEALSKVPSTWRPKKEEVDHIREQLFTEAPAFVEAYSARLNKGATNPDSGEQDV